MKILNFTFLSMVVSGLLFSSCDSILNQKAESTKQSEVVNSKYSIAPPEYEELAAKWLKHIEKFEFQKMGEMVSDNIEYYLPNGGENDRTRFIGREDFMNFWNTYQEITGLDSWKITNIVSFPIKSHDKLKYTNVDGVLSLTYFSMNFKFGEEEANIRANFGFHFNQHKKIDKLYTYYDRTPIIEAAKLNVLNSGKK